MSKSKSNLDNEASQTTNYEQLEAAFIAHPQLREAFKNDATVFSWFQCLRQGMCTLEEAYIGIIIHLVKEKQIQFDEIIRLKTRQL